MTKKSAAALVPRKTDDLLAPDPCPIVQRLGQRNREMLQTILQMGDEELGNYLLYQLNSQDLIRQRVEKMQSQLDELRAEGREMRGIVALVEALRARRRAGADEQKDEFPASSMGRGRRTLRPDRRGHVTDEAASVEALTRALSTSDRQDANKPHPLSGYKVRHYVEEKGEAEHEGI